jgi:hypothetical protein
MIVEVNEKHREIIVFSKYLRFDRLSVGKVLISCLILAYFLLMESFN